MSPSIVFAAVTGKLKGRVTDIETGEPIIPNYLSVQEALWFVLSLPITCLISGNDKLEYLDENLDVVTRFAGLSGAEQARIISSVEKFAEQRALATGKR